MRDMGRPEEPNPDGERISNEFAAQDAEMLAMSYRMDDMADWEAEDKGEAPSGGRPGASLGFARSASSDLLAGIPTQDSWNPAFASSLPSPCSPSSSGGGAHYTTMATAAISTPPVRRRPAAPTSIPNFPSALDVRHPPPQIPSSPPAAPSPPPRSPALTPCATPPQPIMRPYMPMPLTHHSTSPSVPHSPWLKLADSSGAPTPSLDGPSFGRNSPHLGYPFEKLNIGGAWSGGNLLVDPLLQVRRASPEPIGPLGGPRDPQLLLTPGGFASGMSAETLARYKAMAGKPITESIGTDKLDGTAMEVDPSGPATVGLSKPSLPAALARRRASLPKVGLGVSSPATTHVTKAPSPLGSAPISSSSPGLPNKLQPVLPDALRPLLASATTLLLDLRPPSSYQASHLPSAHSVPIPSTLLRRPALDLKKLSQMLSPSSIEAVSKWRDCSDIILIDIDSTTSPASSVLAGLAAKFEREHFAGKMWFVKGGHKAVQASGSGEMATTEAEEDSKGGTPAGPGGLMTGRLGKLAFQQESTGSARGGLRMTLPITPALSLRGDPFAAPNFTTPGSGRSQLTFGQAMRTGDLNDDPTFSVAPLSTPKRSEAMMKLQPANPFFDNIRQNLELSHGGITERIPLALSEHVIQRADELPDWLSGLVQLPEKDSMDRLAEEFERIERGEQKRLQAVMDFHSKGSGAVMGADVKEYTQLKQDAEEVQRLVDWGTGVKGLDDDYFPFSITAGIERGLKNRYKNIWPYDFSRVRLEAPCDDESDYINASFVQPRGTTRRYIASQGPLDATYRDFWTLVWEQNVHVILMLTKQYEGGLLKCGNYWEDQQYGPMRVHFVSQSGGDDAPPPNASGFGFDFGPAAVPPRSDDASVEVDNTIKRTFMLSCSDQPDRPPRKIVQIQSTAWPDFDVPETPHVLLNIMQDVDTAMDDLCGPELEDRGRADHPPVLVHCSAGVGRTGSYIVVDAVCDGLRRERRRQSQVTAASEVSAAAAPGHSPAQSTGLSPLPDLEPLDMSAKRERSSTSSSRSLASATAGSGDFTKSVSFLEPPKRDGAGDDAELSPFVFAASPASLTTPVPAASADNAPSFFPANDASQPISDAKMAAPAVEEQDAPSFFDVKPWPGSSDHTMELDEKPIAGEGFDFDQRFNKHRGSISHSIASTEPDMARRPSLQSNHHSSEIKPVQSMNLDFGVATTVTKSSARHRMPSPLSEMQGSSPIAAVLEGMRVQRMSLVQSLRQYLFAHRAIVSYYLSMIDDEKQPARERSSTSFSSASLSTQSLDLPSRASTAPASIFPYTSGPSSAAGTDDESHSKRRASPTPLTPDSLAIEAGSGGSNLSKRASFKKMRSVGLEGIRPVAGASPGRMRSKSRLLGSKGGQGQ